MALKILLKRRILPASLCIASLVVAAACQNRSDFSKIDHQPIQSILTAETLYAAAPSYSAHTSPPAAAHEMEPSKTKNAQQAENIEPKSEESEIVIPVVVPKKVEPRKAYIEPTVRVKLLGDASSITLTSDGELALSFGHNVMKVLSGSRIRFKPRSTRVSVRSYAVGIATFAGDGYEDALEFAEDWKRQGYTVRLIKAGGPLVQADGTIADTTVYWVALGIFKEKEDAERFRDKMFRRGVSSWVIDENVLGPRGNIEVLDSKGHPRAYADSRIVITSAEPIHIFDVPFGSGFWSSGNRENRRYISPIEIIVDIRGKLAAVNEVKMEEYVKGVVPVEIRLTAHDEALKTQAVSARTEATAKLGIKHVFDPFDYCASQHCQEFGGLTRRTRRTDAAVDATSGEVLMRDGSLVDSVYSANCGGHTEHNENVWTSRPDKSLRGVSNLYSNPESFDSPLPASQLRRWLMGTPRAYCADSRVGGLKNFRWKVTHGANELTKIVNRHRRVGDIKDLQILRRGVSGRAKSMRIVGALDTAVINKELQIRRVLGGLKSSMFIVDVKRDSSGNPTSFTFYGGGWGHGVGMCQSGAEGMALRDFKYAEILMHYFSGAEIKKLYE